MCMLCVEIAKENLKPKEFWQNFKEVDEEHVRELIVAVQQTSESYQESLAQEALSQGNEEDEQ